jgi:hypothetical protein
MGRSCSTHGGEEKCIQDLGWEIRRKETTRYIYIYTRRWENNIKIDLRDRMGWYGLD